MLFGHAALEMLEALHLGGLRGYNPILPPSRANHSRHPSLTPFSNRQFRVVCCTDPMGFLFQFSIRLVHEQLHARFCSQRSF